MRACDRSRVCLSSCARAWRALLSVCGTAFIKILLCEVHHAQILQPRKRGREREEEREGEGEKG